MIRVAAVGDVHFGLDSAGVLRPHLSDLPSRADLLLLAGDLTKWGDPAEAKVLASELDGLEVPVVAVLGNHDHHLDQPKGVRAAMEDVGVTMLEGEATRVHVNGRSIGVAGTKGFGGGFTGASASEFGEEEMKRFVRATKASAETMERSLSALDTDIRVALFHYSPVKETLRGEPPEIYAFLGSYLLAEAVDRVGANLILHGHAHRGAEKGLTPGGIHVRNVAQSVIGRPYNVYHLDV